MTAAVNYTHGGDLDRAAREYGIPREQWLDLSTGIAPWSWPVPDIPEEVWQRLPSVECPLVEPAAAYYGCDPSAVLAIPGSQFVIQTLPGLFSRCRVAMPEMGYFEHRKAWQAAGHRLLDYVDSADAELDRLEAHIQSGELDVVLVINPNNPTTEIIDKARLLRWADLLAQRGGLLIVDEAFMDMDGAMSLASKCPRSGLVVLRSLGKFYGLAGLRLGFLLAEAELKERLHKLLGPWAVSGPAQYVGARALADHAWQRAQRQRAQQTVAAQMENLQAVFSAFSEQQPFRLACGPLFLSTFLQNAEAQRIAGRLGERGICVRRFSFQHRQTGCLRFGLVSGRDQMLRLREALTECLG